MVQRSCGRRIVISPIIPQGFPPCYHSSIAYTAGANDLASYVGGHRDLRPRKVHDLATYAEPNQLSVGMDYVFVNGVPVIADGKMTNALPGKILYGPGYTGPR